MRGEGLPGPAKRQLVTKSAERQAEHDFESLPLRHQEDRSGRSLGVVCQAGVGLPLGGGTSGFVSSILLVGVSGLGFVAVGADDAPATL